MKIALGLPDIPASASPLPVRPNPAEQLDFAIRILGGGISRRPSLERLTQEAHSRRGSGGPTPRALASRGADQEAL